MTIRTAQVGDIPHIVDLLKLSLGDVSTRKSESYWRWKHIDNPFGPSHVLLAEERGTLVGVRAFMQWRWTDGQQEYVALRAVDTATHPKHQGKGIFKKLTLALIEQRTAAGDDFIFNTPNDQSRPGYLKMGWEELGRLPVSVKVHRPFSALKNKLRGTPGREIKAIQSCSFNWDLSYDLPTAPQLQGWRTAKRPNYLRWRYRDCPVADYFALGEPGKYLIILHEKSTVFGTEFRLVEAEVNQGCMKEAKRALDQLIREHRPVFTSVAPSNPFAGQGFWITRNIGPTLTYRELNFGSPPALDQWSYQLGDMELF